MRVPQIFEIEIDDGRFRIRQRERIEEAVPIAVVRERDKAVPERSGRGRPSSTAPLAVNVESRILIREVAVSIDDLVGTKNDQSGESPGS
ncbi:MAG TPA: hypothetical protein VK669_10015 [Candidatus Limnocylindrales bacterium]|nr:hypothetical protein [Candidatus Limnocylindrales bacterium]